MNNKGFAITGILYTLFIIFLSILLSVLATISAKKGMLEKTISGLEDSFATTNINPVNEKTYEKIDATNKTIALKNAKYEFQTILQNDEIMTCSIYMKKGQEMPNNGSTITRTNRPDKFILIPNDCNDYTFTIQLDSTIYPTENVLTLKKVYEFKDMD